MFSELPSDSNNSVEAPPVSTGTPPDPARAEKPPLSEPPYKPYSDKPSPLEPTYEPYKGM